MPLPPQGVHILILANWDYVISHDKEIKDLDGIRVGHPWTLDRTLLL